MIAGFENVGIVEVETGLVDHNTHSGVGCFHIELRGGTCHPKMIHRRQYSTIQ